MTDYNNVIRHFRQELLLHRRHCSHLEAEQRALIACDRKSFAALQPEHNEILRLIAAMQPARSAVLTTPEGRELNICDIIRSAPPRERQIISALRHELMAALERARDLSKRNHVLIQNELRYFTFALDMFVHAARSTKSRYSGCYISNRMFLDRAA